MAKDDDDEPFDGLDVDLGSDLPVHEEFASNRELRSSELRTPDEHSRNKKEKKVKKAGLKNIRKF
jgi:hypothetical protein